MEMTWRFLGSLVSQFMAMQIVIIQGPTNHDLIKHIPTGVPGDCTNGTIRLSGQKRQIHNGMKGITRLKSFCNGRIFWIIVKVAHDKKIGWNGWVVLQGL